MKPLPRDHQRVRDLAEKVIEQRLAQPPTADEIELAEYLRQIGEEIFLEPYDDTDWARKEARRLYWEIYFGLDKEWPPVSRESFSSDDEWERFLIVRAKEQQCHS